MYGITYGMKGPKKTTIYLPADLKRRIEKTSKRQKRSEAEVIRDAVSQYVEEQPLPEPRIPLVAKGLGAPDIAERVDELLDGFGR